MAADGDHRLGGVCQSGIGKCLIEGFHPVVLPRNRRPERLGTALGQYHEMSPRMVRVGPKSNETISVKVVDNALHALPAQMHVTCDMRNRLGSWRVMNGTHDLPARKAEANVGHHIIGAHSQRTTQAQCLNDEPGQDVR